MQEFRLWEPRAASSPPDLWRKKAASFADWAAENLWERQGADTRQWLKEERGLNQETIRTFKLGWNPRDSFLDRSVWGLPEEIKENGKPKKLCLPGGLVIPAVDKCGNVIRIRIRREAPGEGPKYITLPGSSMQPMVCGVERRPVVMIVESDLDGMLVHQEAGDLICVISLGSAQLRPDTEVANLLAGSDLILLSLDADEAGAKQALGWWTQDFQRWCLLVEARLDIRRWPCIMGKDPAEAMRAGMPIRKWVQAALPGNFLSKNVDDREDRGDARIEPDEGQEAEDSDKVKGEPSAEDGNGHKGEAALVKCALCSRLKDDCCIADHNPQGIALLRSCDDFICTKGGMK